MTVCDPPSVDRDLYRRRQRRRAIIGWGVLGVVVVLVGLAIVLGGGESSSGSGDSGEVDVFSYEMSSSQYDQIHKGQEESLVLTRLGNVGLQEDEATEALTQMFPAQPSGSTCSYWRLSDAPEHLVRLCFSDPQGVLVQKTVRAPGEGGAETTLA